MKTKQRNCALDQEPQRGKEPQQGKEPQRDREPQLNKEPSREQRVYIALAQVPAGKIVTYGQLAELAGLPRAARLIGYILRNLPSETRLPWHRVINAAGKISLGPESDSGLQQRTLLQEEGVIFNQGRISLKQFRWQPLTVSNQMI